MQARKVHGTLVVGIVLMSLAAACASSANPSPTTGPTIQAIATAAAPAVQATATSVAPTVQALATEAGPVAATATAAAPVHVTSVNLNGQDSTVTLQDVGNQAVNLSNWSLEVGTARTQLPSSLNMQPGQMVRVHTASGTSSQTDVYLGQNAQTIANALRPGAQIVLANPSGAPVSSFVVPNG